MELEDEISDMAKNKPEPLVEVTEDGRMLRFITLSDILQPEYKVCKTCEVRKICNRFDEDSERCIIEVELLQTLMINLHETGLAKSDELLIYPLTQSLFRMKRLYRIETLEDLLAIFNNPDRMKMYKDRMKILNNTELTYIRILKELLATRKEYEKKKIINVGSSSSIISMVDEIVEQQDKENNDADTED